MPLEEKSYMSPRDQERFQVARDAAIRSFFNRYGRIPAGQDLAESLVHFLPSDLQSLALVGGDREGSGNAPPTRAETPAIGEKLPDFGGYAVRWVLERRYGRPPTDDEVRQYMKELSTGAGAAKPQIEFNFKPQEGMSLSRLRSPPFERAPLAEPPPTFYERQILPILRWPNRLLPLDHVPDLPLVGGRRG